MSLSNPGDDIRLLKARIGDMAEQCEKNCMPVFSDFLDEKQIACARSELNLLGIKNFMFWGGYENAQRQMLCIHTEYYVPEKNEFPINVVEFIYRKSDVLSHRDFLGSIMACRVKREKVGDILVSEGKTQVLVSNSVSEFLAGEINKIGRTGVKTAVAEKCTIQRIQSYDDIKGTVASLRLDCILSLALKKSREKTIQIIKKDGVELNYTAVFSPSAIIKENDIFSVRGFGKFRLESVSGLSSKGRFHILIQKFI